MQGDVKHFLRGGTCLGEVYRFRFRARAVRAFGAGVSSSGYFRKIPCWLNAIRRFDAR